MSAYMSKIELIVNINRLIQKGKHDEAIKLQKIFLNSIRQDLKVGKYSAQIELDRGSKKVVKSLKDLELVE